MRQLLQFALFFLLTAPAFAATWFVRTDGGPIYYSGLAGDSCNGKADVGMTVGGGANQSCAVNDFRYLYMNGPVNWAWIISGGDTVVIRGCTASSGQQNPDNPHCRIGNDVAAPGHGSTGFCAGVQPNSGCTNPPIPSGTSGAHTRILGGCAYDSTPGPCHTGNVTNNANLTQLFGGFDVYPTMDLSGTQYVDVEGLELTDHNNCIKHGDAGLPSRCATDGTEDYADDGIFTSNTTSNILLQDLYIHGFPSSGIYGSIGGPFVLTRITINDNGFAGWNFDNLTANGPGAGITASYVTMQFNGCNEEYPMVDPIPITYCYSVSDGGFGDAWSGQDAYLSYFTGDHLLMRYNVKDVFFGPHTAQGVVTITDSAAYGNGGQTWKGTFGYDGTLKMTNTLTLSNCNRMSAAITGAPSTFNTYIWDFCRADGTAISIIWPIVGSIDLDGNTFGTASSNVAFDFSCWYQLDGATITQAGTGYQVGDVLLPGGSGATVTVTSIGAGGTITGVSVSHLGQWTSSTYDENNEGTIYISGGHGTGAQITMTSSTTANCGQGPRVMRDNIFFGITDQTGPSWNDETISFICYSGCQSAPGDANDTQWTTRGYNLFYGYQTGACGGGNACGVATYANESIASPLFVGQPSITILNQSAEANYDVFNPVNAGNSFLLTSGSPAKYGGETVSGLTTDYYGATRPSPPSMGGVEFGSGPSGSYTLTVSTTTGTGTGTINITNNCQTGSFTSGTTIGPCTATPNAGSVFAGWTGTLGCTGTGTCTASLTANSTMNAVFNLAPTSAPATMQGIVSIQGTAVIQ